MSATLGKRKEREGDDDTHGSTLFVSNLPYTATSVDLETLFSDVAPVRTAFIVTEQGSGVSKGVGYVSFALKEDAESCYTRFSEGAWSIAGRKLRVQWADKKVRKPENGAEEKMKEKKKEIKSRPLPVARVPHDPLAVRTVIISGLPSPLDFNTLWKKIRKCPGAEDVTWPVKKDDGQDDPAVAHALFSHAGTAQDAVNKLHAHVYKGSLLSVTLKKRVEILAKPIVKKSGASVPTVVAAPNRASRLIVRNLPFDVTEQDLRALFLPYGPVHSITLPVAEAKDKETDDAEDEGEEAEAEGEEVISKAEAKPRNKGFAFVWMLSKKDAEKALEGCNGKSIRAGLAVELVSGKQKRKKQLRLEKKMKNAPSKSAGADEEPGEGEGEGEEEDGGDGGTAAEDRKVGERVIAVDWALSKEKWKEEMAKMEEDKAVDEDVEMGHVSDVESSSESESEDGSDDERLGVHDDDDDDESGSSQDEDDDEDRDTDDEEPTKPQLPPPEAGTTLFVRNLPYIATEDELRALFRVFGPLRYARITLDPGTGRSRGTGFACFWNKEDADKVIEQSEILRSETTGLADAPKKNPFSLPSILTADPSSSLARSLVLHGRTLDVVRAVARETASKLREEGEKLREKQDKRNMYLLREGIIHANSPAAATLSAADVERRTGSYNARRTLLKSNPSLFISKTRLSVRQIPLFVSERMLKRLAVHAVRAFKKEVKEGTRQNLTEDEIRDRDEGVLDVILKKGLEEAGGVVPTAKSDTVSNKIRKAKGRDTGVKQTKIVRQAERVDAMTGKGRSKGYGFIEMTTHADSLRVLRWANNNESVHGLFEAWYKEELGDLLKRAKATVGASGKDGSSDKGAEEVDAARLKRIKEALETGSGKGKKEGRGMLIVEFSIENVQVVQRRAAAAAGGLNKEKRDDKETPKPKPRRPSNDEVDEADDGSRKAKRKESSSRPKKSKRGERSAGGDDSQPTDASANKRRKVEKSDDAASKKVFNPVGAVIGRKRKEKKMGKKKA